MALRVQVVQASSQSLWRALKTLATGNLALLADEYLKSALPVRSFDDMLRVLTGVVSEKKTTIGELTINGHGNETGFRVGEDWIDLKSLDGFRNQFCRLKTLLDPAGALIIGACEVGKARDLLLAISRVMGNVSVVAYDAEQPGGLGPVGQPTIANQGSGYSPAAPAAGVSAPSAPAPR